MSTWTSASQMSPTPPYSQAMDLHARPGGPPFSAFVATDPSADPPGVEMLVAVAPNGAEMRWELDVASARELGTALLNAAAEAVTLQVPSQVFKPGDLVRVEQQPADLPAYIKGERAFVGRVVGTHAHLAATDLQGRNKGGGWVPTACLVHEESPTWRAVQPSPQLTLVLEGIVAESL